jgi:hypothetical protein
MSAIRMWAVKRPGGQLMYETVSQAEWRAWDEALWKSKVDLDSLRKMKKRGYRCVRVRVEVES